MLPSPKAASASALARSNAAGSSSGVSTTRIPFPPPPPAAFKRTGYPISAAAPSAPSTATDSVPGTSGTPAAASSRFASTLSPMRAITSASGPMKTSSLSSQACTKSGFSDRKPYPGWTASQPVVSAAASTGGIFRYLSVGDAGPMQTARSARRVCSAPASAVEYTATASIPSSCSARMTRTAISPRLATSTRENIVRELRRSRSSAPSQGVQRSAVDGLEFEEELSELHGLRVVDEDRPDNPVHVGLHLVHQLHRLEDAQRLPRADVLPLLHERRRAGLRGAVERADHRRLDADEAVRRRHRQRQVRIVRRSQ